jgi:iron(III) transport system permease protein
VENTKRLAISSIACPTALREPGRIFGAVLLLVVAVLTVYPLGMLIWGSFRTAPPGAPGEFTLQNYVSAYSSPVFLQVIGNSLIIGVGVTLASIVTGALVAWIVTRTDTPFARVLENLFVINFYVPGLLLAVAWTLLASPRSGSLNQFLRAALPFPLPPLDVFSYWGIIWVMFLHLAPLVTILVTPAFRSMDPSLEEAAEMAGADQRGTLRRITLPLMLPALLSATLLIFIRTIEAFEAPLFFGNPAGIFVFTNLIYTKLFAIGRPDYAGATALSIALMAVTFSLVAFQIRLLGSRSYTTVTGRGYNPSVMRLGPWKYLAFALCCLFLLISVVAPITQIIVASFSQLAGIYTVDNFTLKNYQEVFADRIFWQGLSNTILLAFVGATSCVGISAAIAYVVLRTRLPGRKLLEALAWLPWATPGVVLGVGMLWGYIYLPAIYGTPWVLLLAFITLGLPLGVRTIHGTLIQISHELEESARVHGASTLTLMGRVLVPLLRGGLMAAFVLLFVSFAQQLSVAAFLSTSQSRLLSVVLLEYWTLGRMEKVSVVALIMVGLMLAIVNIERMLRRWG